MAILIIDGVCDCAVCVASKQAAQIDSFNVWATKFQAALDYINSDESQSLSDTDEFYDEDDFRSYSEEDRRADEAAELDFYMQEMEQYDMAEETAAHMAEQAREAYGWCP